jgi:hypothetical protein
MAKEKLGWVPGREKLRRINMVVRCADVPGMMYAVTTPIAEAGINIERGSMFLDSPQSGFLDSPRFGGERFTFKATLNQLKKVRLALLLIDGVTAVTGLGKLDREPPPDGPPAPVRPPPRFSNGDAEPVEMRVKCANEPGMLNAVLEQIWWRGGNIKEFEIIASEKPGGLPVLRFAVWISPDPERRKSLAETVGKVSGVVEVKYLRYFPALRKHESNTPNGFSGSLGYIRKASPEKPRAPDVDEDEEEGPISKPTKRPGPGRPPVAAGKRQAVIHELELGHTFVEAAGVVGLSVNTVAKIAREEELSSPHARLSDEKRGKIIGDFELEGNLSRVARKHRVDHKTVSRIVKEDRSGSAQPRHLKTATLR